MGKVTRNIVSASLPLLLLLSLPPLGSEVVAQSLPSELATAGSRPTFRQTVDAQIAEAGRLLTTDPAKAYTAALKANLFSQAANYRRGQVESLILAGYAQHLLKDYDTAVILFLGAEAIAQDVGEPLHRLLALGGRARSYSSQSKSDELAIVDAQIYSLALDSGYSPGDAVVIATQGGDLAMLQPEQAKGRLLAELEAASGRGELEVTIQILRELAFIHVLKGEFKEALQRLDEQIRLLNPKDTVEKALALASIGGLEHAVGKPEEALTHYREAMELFRGLNSDMGKVGEAYTLGGIADTYRDLLNVEDALESYLRAGSLYGSLGYYRQAAATSAGAAGVFAAIGNHEKALEYTKNGLDLIRRAKDLSYEGYFLISVGSAYMAQKDILKAAESFNTALELARDRSDRLLEAFALGGIGGIHAHLKQYQQARDSLVKALKRAREVQNPRIEGGILDVLSRVSFLSKDVDAARAFATQELQVGEATKDFPMIGYARYNLGRAMLDEGRLSEAIPLLKEVVTMIETVRGRLVSEVARLGLLEGKDAVYYDLIRALLTLHGQDGTIGYDREAFEYTERARARTLAEFLSTLRAKAEKGPASGLKRREIALRNRIASLDAQLMNQDLWPRIQRANPSELQADLEAANREYAAIVAELKRTHPATLPFSMADPISLKEVQSLLTDGAVLIEYVVTETQLVILAISAGELHPILVSVDQEDLNARIGSFRNKLERHTTGFEKDAKYLYDLLVTPIRPFFGGAKRLVISPHGELHHVAFGALINPQTNRFLIEDAPLSFVPGASILKWLQVKARPAQSSILALGIGNFEKLPPLSQAETEVRDIAKLFRDRLVLVGDEATLPRLKQAARRYNIIHLASHAQMDFDAPLLSRIILKGDRGHDVNLYTSDIFDLDLEASLVTLSACETSLGTIRGGNEVLGFVRGFLFAGASSVIASQWKVNDASTAELMLALYRSLRNGRPKDEALQDAQKDLLASKHYAHPYYWAAFSLTGDRR